MRTIFPATLETIHQGLMHMTLTFDDIDSRGSARGAVFFMTLCVFVLIASEFTPVSLLTPIAADLGVSEGNAPARISFSGIFAVLTSLFIATLIRRLDRRFLLLALTGLLMLWASPSRRPDAADVHVQHAKTKRFPVPSTRRASRLRIGQHVEG